MNAKRATVNVSLATALAIVVGLLVSIAPTDASAQTYWFPHDSEGWRYMGLFDGGGLTRLRDFVIGENPWTGVDGGGAILLGQEGFTTPRSPSLENTVHGDLVSPLLSYAAGRTVRLSWDITGSHLRSKKRVWVQAVLLVSQPIGGDRLFISDFIDVPTGFDGAWDTHTFIQRLPARSTVKQISLRISFQTESYYEGWIMVDNVSLN
jgi:hypothetical protein